MFVGKLLPSNLSPLTDSASATSTAAQGGELVAVDPDRALPEAVAALEPRQKQQDRIRQGLTQASANEGDAGLLDYLPPSRLSVRPKALAPREVPFPEEITEAVDLRVVVSLFIDETGKVRRVRLDNPAIPPAFAQSIISTFLSTEFTPGKVDAVPVRSLIRVEVGFQGGPARR